LENYFNYFTEIEHRYQKRRGTGLLLSTVDWALIETWKDAGIPLEAVLRGIDETFDKYEKRPAKPKKINSLTYCSQEVLSAAEEMKEAAVGAATTKPGGAPGLEQQQIVNYLAKNAGLLRAVKEPEQVAKVAAECASAIDEVAAEISSKSEIGRLEDVERRMTVLEEKLLAALTVTAEESRLVQLRAEAEREIAPYRSKMPGPQIQQLIKQFVHKRLFEQAKMPRLSLFYM
jgi:hypothetical protein